MRIAMSERGWAALEREALHTPAPTHARAIGRVIERALGTAPDVDWQEWQIRKEKQLLGRAS